MAKPKDKNKNLEKDTEVSSVSETSQLEPSIADEIEGIPTYGKPLDEMIEGSFNPETILPVEALPAAPKEILSPQKKLLKTTEAPESVEPVITISSIKAEQKPQDLSLSKLALELADASRKAEKQGKFAIAGEFHNANSVVGSALNKIKELSADALEFINQK